MADMTNEHLAEIRARAEAATPDVKRICNDMIFKADKMLHANDMPTGFELGWLLRRVIPSLEKLRQYREDVPALLAEVERLRAELEVAKAMIERACSWNIVYGKDGLEVMLRELTDFLFSTSKNE